MSKKYINADNLSISEDLYKFINNEAIPGTNISKDEFYKTAVFYIFASVAVSLLSAALGVYAAKNFL